MYVTLSKSGFLFSSIFLHDVSLLSTCTWAQYKNVQEMAKSTMPDVQSGSMNARAWEKEKYHVESCSWATTSPP